ncbi:SGNH/GDSL hydrolase family protein [Variovorax boronicumulans]|uniref:SGNH/GDSL hydrolase family protein n=1 Tax=Variovorax boronicumulans TaxID=436515 RepID=UPI001C5699B1
MWKIWFVSINFAVAIWVVFDIRKRLLPPGKWLAGAFLFTVAALPVYLARTGRGRPICAASVILYVVAVLAGMPYGVFENIVKTSPFWKHDVHGEKQFMARKLPDAVWENKRILAVGTSITAGAAAPYRDGFVDRAVRWHGATLVNAAVGSSGIVWDGKRARSLGATRAELTEKGFDPDQSFESRLLGKRVDLVLFDHGYNDRDHPLGSIDDQTPSTLYGAYNRVIKALLAEQPDVQMVFITPPTLLTPYSAGRDEHTGTAAVREAVFAIAKKYDSRVLDMTHLAGFDRADMDAGAFLDSVHPVGASHHRMAHVLQRFLADF